MFLFRTEPWRRLWCYYQLVGLCSWELLSNILSYLALYNLTLPKTVKLLTCLSNVSFCLGNRWKLFFVFKVHCFLLRSSQLTFQWVNYFTIVFINKVLLHNNDCLERNLSPVLARIKSRALIKNTHLAS